jgi:hypothetical protein
MPVRRAFPAKAATPPRAKCEKFRIEILSCVAAYYYFFNGSITSVNFFIKLQNVREIDLDNETCNYNYFLFLSLFSFLTIFESVSRKELPFKLIPSLI